MGRITRCTSCRKLKIACDRGRPCEYCRETGRKCQYESDLEVLEISKLSSLDETHKQLGITKFEHRLLYHFNEVFIPDTVKQRFGDIRTMSSERRHNLSPIEKLWAFELPWLWQQSPMVRQNMYAILLMLLMNYTDTIPLMIEDLEIADNAVPTCERISLSYFNRAIATTNERISKVLRGEVDLQVFGAAEIVFLGIFLFIYLVTQPYEVIHVVSDDPEETDLIRMVKSIKLSMIPSFPLLVNTRYHGVFYFSELFGDPPARICKFPISDHLRETFRDISHNYTVDQASRFDRALLTLDKSLQRSIDNKDPGSYITRWIFLLDLDIYDMMIDRDPFSLKLLYYYCCLTLLFGLRMTDPRISLRHFLWYYQDFQMAAYGGWVSQVDRDFFYLILLGHKFTVQDVDLLTSFMPGDYNDVMSTSPSSQSDTTTTSTTSSSTPSVDTSWW